MNFDEEAVISAERALEAMTWLRERVSAHCPAEEVARELGKLQSKRTTIQSIEAVRRAVQQRERQLERRAQAVHAMTDRYATLCKQWQDGGCDVVRDLLDPDAVRETDALADVLAALSVDAERCARRGALVDALSRLAEDFARAEERKSERELAMGCAREAIRDGVQELRNAVRTLDAVQRGVSDAEARTERLVERHRATVDETRRCEEAGEAARAEVVTCGVDDSIRHERIARDGARVRQLERKLESIRLELDKYHGLPAVSASGEMRLCVFVLMRS